MITVRYSISQFFAHLPCPSSNLVYRSLESTLHQLVFLFLVIVGCLDGWIRHANDCYIFIEEPLSWMDAKEECDKIGSHLAIVKDQDVGKLLISRWPEISISLFW